MPFLRAARAKTRGRARTRGNFSNALNDLKRTLIWSKSNFEHFSILTHAYAHVMAIAKVIMIQDIVPDLKFMPTIIDAEITFRYEDMINNVTLSENHKMAPRWRHTWLISLKSLLCLFMDMTNDLGNFHVDWSWQFWDILWTKWARKKEE